MAKRKTKVREKSPTRIAYEQEYKKLQSRIWNVKKQGYTVPENIIPVAPSKVKRVSPKMVQEMRELRGKDIKKASTYTTYRGEIRAGEEQYKLERHTDTIRKRYAMYDRWKDKTKAEKEFKEKYGKFPSEYYGQYGENYRWHKDEETGKYQPPEEYWADRSYNYDDYEDDYDDYSVDEILEKVKPSTTETPIETPISTPSVDDLPENLVIYNNTLIDEITGEIVVENIDTIKDINGDLVDTATGRTILPNYKEKSTPSFDRDGTRTAETSIEEEVRKIISSIPEVITVYTGKGKNHREQNIELSNTKQMLANALDDLISDDEIDAMDYLSSKMKDIQKSVDDLENATSTSEEVNHHVTELFEILTRHTASMSDATRITESMEWL